MFSFKLSGREVFSEPHFCTKHFHALISPDHSEKGNIGGVGIFSCLFGKTIPGVKGVDGMRPHRFAPPAALPD